MVRAKNQFDHSFIRISRIDGIYLHSVNNLGIPHGDVEDLLRSEIVYAVSALDKMIHELVKIGMVEIFLGTRPYTSAFGNYQLSLSQQAEIAAATHPIPPAAIFQGIIERKHSFLSFQDPEKLKDALGLVWDEPHKWQKIATALGLTMNAAKGTLNNIVIRRNQIAHEMDLDLSSGITQTLTHTDTQDMVTYVKNLGDQIFILVSTV
ncbi:HEPN domain-containing protein [Pedobacter sp. UBA5917]|jgi:hypothetical protein|uniref:HEPN domain-containing protein n=1 Tax=Pedobacter sp. UBA5917 TaxID=1947061 RepID=UPI0025DE5F02|nr:HEPN domain-containing protein [Pedobacter sp. UBA5917]